MFIACISEKIAKVAYGIKAVKEKMNGRIFPISAPVFRISSTDIRNRVKNGQTVRYMLPENVRDYINKYHLYKENENDR